MLMLFFMANILQEFIQECKLDYNQLW